MDRAPITLDDIFQDVRRKVETLPDEGRIEIVIYKSNNALNNHEIRTVDIRKGKITLS
jgi:hypothetical protein